MGKPRLIILCRHAQSEGNKNREIHQTIPDHRVKLTPEGHRQAREAGKKLRSLLRPDDKLHFFTSPYLRARETTEGILESLTSDSPEPSPFPRNTIKVWEEPRLREQDFGNFQPSSTEMTRMWHERANYGHFFYRIPNGESAADAYDRISGFNESLWRSFGEDDFASVCVLVTHGLMTRVFLMKWYHWSVEYFEDLRNVNHCEFIVMALNKDNGKYVLKNRLRTWSEYKRELEESGQYKPSARNNSPIPMRKKWLTNAEGQGGSGSREFERKPPQRQNTADLFREDSLEEKRNSSHSSLKGAFAGPEKGSVESRGPCARMDRAMSVSAIQEDESAQTQHERKSSFRSRLLSPNTIVAMTAGRDGGGSLSGEASREGSSEGESDDEMGTRPEAALPDKMTAESSSRDRRGYIQQPRSLALALSGAFDIREPLRSDAMADALGDQSDMDEDSEEVKTTKAEENSFEGSVR